MFRKKKRDDDDPFDGFFDEFTRVEEFMNEIMKDMFSGKGKIEMGKPYVYGFSVRTGPDGKPVFNEFGNVKPSGSPVVSDEREPLVDVVDEGRDIVITAELPGVNKEDIELELNEGVLEIKVDTERRAYYKSIALPAKVKTDDVTTSYNNGILEVRLPKTEPTKKREGKKIKIK
ncbi:MAG: Hsp20/alpha crystallin family protein [Candidatus Altiarchaeota archaeon]|nr:Hsp20/alpha crystallin family protein [Candidatus Altiarchaeota archaeon]